MSLLKLYNDLRTRIEAIHEIKHVRLFNNQFERENVENAFLYPCCFIEFKPSNYKDLLMGVQQYDLIVTLHLGFESYQDEDTEVLALKQMVYEKVHRFQTEYFSLLSRVEERQNYDHSNIQVYETDYKTTGKDFDADTRPTTQKLITPQVIGVIVKPNAL